MRPLRSKPGEAMGHGFARVPAFLLLGVLVVGGCGGGSDETSQEAAGDQRTTTPAATAIEPPVEEAPALAESQVKASAVSFPLREENDSGRSGRAVVQKSGRGGTEVLLTLSQRAGESNYAHFHDTTCSAYRGMTFNQQLATIVDNLESVADGTSKSVLDLPVGRRTTGGYSINVHEVQEPFMVVACGDVPRR